ncbi:MAG: hypothetical protein KC466_06790, partial [Myxococcales bacterium]|nr:hypothetical protein [Myxococcales bacterium]
MADLVKRYDIDRFLVSAGTAVASAAAEAFIEEFPSTRSPLVLYGPPGAGKSHLLHAIGNAVAAGEKAARVLLLAPGGPGPEEGGPGPTLVLVDDVGPEHAAWLERMAARPGALWCWTTPTDPRGWPGPPEGLRAWVDQGRIMDLAPAGVEVLEALVDEWLDRRGGHLDAGLRA